MIVDPSEVFAFGKSVLQGELYWIMGIRSTGEVNREVSAVDVGSIL